MDLKPQDIIHLSSSQEEWNGFFIIQEITPLFIRLRNPKEEYTIPIEIDKLVGVEEVVLVHSALIPGYAETRGFVPEKKIRIDVDFQSESLHGIIQTLEKDMIEVLLSDGEMIYIDFEYKGPPSSILSIVVDSDLEIEYEEMDIFVSESHSRFTLDRQLNDLMDHLVTKQTTRQIQEATKIVQRFKELRNLHSTTDLEPKWSREKKYPWIVPVVSLLRKIYPQESDTIQWIKDVQELQVKDESYISVYRKIMNELQPFFNERGVIVNETKMTIISSGKICKAKDKTKEAKLIPQVVTVPYELLHTPPEIIQPIYHFAFSTDYSQYKSTQLPLLQKLCYHSIIPHITYENGIKMDKIKLPNFQDCLVTFPLYSIYSFLQYLGPFDMKKNDLREDDIFRMMFSLLMSVQNYKKKKYPSYHSNPPKEALLMENVALHATIEAMSFVLDEKKSLDKITIDTSKPVSPPIVKVYTTEKALKADNSKNEEKIIFYDQEFDTTSYDEMSAYTTIEEMMRYLIQVKRMVPSVAALYAPFFLEQKKRIITGEYAKLGNSYYKRIQGNWKLDETCSGPYPCTSSEPDCEPNCPDLSFRLKQNTLNSLLQEIKVDYYTSQLKRNTYLQQKKETFTRNEKRITILRERQKSMYTLAKTAVVHITESPYLHLLHFILQKPYQERYKELKEFIKQYTRVALKGEDSSWYYCEETDTKLIPLVFERLIEAYETDMYASQLEVLKKDGHIQVQDDSLVTTVGGFLVSTLDGTASFDDLVRSTVVEDFFLELPRDVHPNTSLIVELLSTTSTISKVNVTKYFNYMIHELVSEKDLAVKSIAFVLKIAEIVYQTNIEDVIPNLLKHKERFNTILKRFYMTEEEITRKMIIDEMKIVATKYGVQMIQTKAPKKTIATSWDTFLPPFQIKSTQEGFKKMYELQESVKRVDPMTTTKITSWEGHFIREPLHVPKINTKMKTIPFTFQSTAQPVLSGSAILLDKIVIVEEKKPSNEAFGLLIPPLKKELIQIINVDFIQPTLPLFYLRTFIQNIARSYPCFLQHKISFEQISLSILPNLAYQHIQKLNELMKKQIFSEIRKFNSVGLGIEKLLQDEEITNIMNALQNPCIGRLEYEYYIFFIFKKYVDYGDRKRTSVLLNIYIDYFMKEYKGIYLTYAEIQRKTLKDRATEANQRRVLFNGMDAEKKYVSTFLEEANLTRKAQLGRIRDYEKERYEGGEFVDTEAIDLDENIPLDLSLNQMDLDNNGGDDGNDDYRDDKEE
jgi:hypothetical protein